jgi:hypothetical protein
MFFSELPPASWFAGGSVLISSRAGVAVNALEAFVIYVTPFLILGPVVKFLLRRCAVDLGDIQAQAGAKRRKCRAFLLGSRRTEK